MNNVCSNCGSEKAPIKKAAWSTKDKIIAVILLLIFFPIGIIYIIVKNTSSKQLVCPDCKKLYSGVQDKSTSEDFDKMKNVVKTVAKDPNVRRAVKDVKNSLSELRDTFYVN